jgi:basic membrane protein A
MSNTDRIFNARRHFSLAAAGLCAAPFLSACSNMVTTARPLHVAALFAGQINDRGFMEAGWRGLERARAELGVKVTYIDGVQPRKELLTDALVKLAQSGADLVVAHGGQNNEACAEVAARFPAVRFVVTQGAVTSHNLASYDVLQEESAYLGGVLAALTTRTGVVGHMSGIRVRPGLKGRAAYAAGVRATNPNVKLLTNFSGNQDDNALSRRVALAQIASGADVIFTMLNAGRNGVTEACREKGAREIGNVVDWVQIDSKVFVASAIADVGIGVFEAVRDLQRQAFPAGVIRKIGLANPQAVRLTMAPDVPADIQSRIAKVAMDINSGLIKVPENYDGPEFVTPA